MNKPWDVLAELTATDSKNSKQHILYREAKAKNDEFFLGVGLAFDNMVTFGVKKIDKKVGNGPGLKADAFFKLCEDLNARRLTGDAARDAINNLKDQATAQEWNGWYRLILQKDLKAGFSETTLNKVCKKDFPDYSVAVFECQLAKDCVDETGQVDETLLQGKKQIDVKLDGIRVLTIVYPTGRVDQVSRNGKELLNFGLIKEQIAKTAKHFKVPTVLDGEMMSASFQDMMKQARRKTNVQADDSIYHLFDIVPLAEFLQGKSKLKQFQRTAELLAWEKANVQFLDNVVVVGNEVVDLGTKAGEKRLLQLNAMALEIDANTGKPKYEGVMLKDVDAPYECKRSNNWLKMKPFIEETLTVVDVERGDVNSKFRDTLGALVCEGVVDGKNVRVSVGGGYSIQLRAQIYATHTGKPQFWKKKTPAGWVQIEEKPGTGKIIGLLAEVRADALTKSENSDTWSMRFPRFKTFRGFTPGEKI
jgi:DNA ligase-1